MSTTPSTVPAEYAEVRRRILDSGTALNKRAELLDHLYGLAFIEGKMAGGAELRDRLQDVFTAPLLEQSVENAKARKAMQP